MTLNHQSNKILFRKWKWKLDNAIYNKLHEINPILELSPLIYLHNSNDKMSNRAFQNYTFVYIDKR